jgi:hypothetical protein
MNPPMNIVFMTAKLISRLAKTAKNPPEIANTAAKVLNGKKLASQKLNNPPTLFSSRCNGSKSPKKNSS